ncbi:unnamed protein product [Prorocentrum cordatum]|uniref:Subtilisin n=1 Tax=Prorocentrum cordatum TaxID=2364126 RepID=A0ABN9XAD4_9DINO|nr:unnamed protein product [Polarella glacialis]
MARRPSSLLARAGAAGGGALAAAAFECGSDVDLGANASILGRKGVNIDDSTMQWCTSQIADVWPNVAGSHLSSIRLFKAWDVAWDPGERINAWAGLLRYVEQEDAKVLLGTPITCNETSDSQAWEWAKELAGLLGPRHIMGLAIGNELELLQFKSEEHVPEGCVDWVFSPGATEDGYPGALPRPAAAAHLGKLGGRERAATAATLPVFASLRRGRAASTWRGCRRLEATGGLMGNADALMRWDGFR